MNSNSLGNMYIPSDGFISVFSDLNFENGGFGIQPGIISTNRSSKPGAVNFVNAEWTNANDFKHVDGYVRVLDDSPFIFPIGDLGFFKPLAISGAKGTTAAYYLDNPKKLNNLELRSRNSSDQNNITISDTEYWHLKGTKATHITLTWDLNSDIEELCNGNLEDLKICAWNGEAWIVLPSVVDGNVLDISQSKAKYLNQESNFNAGSITTLNEIIPNNISYITFGTEFKSDKEEIDFVEEKIENENIELTVFPNPTFNLNNLKVDYSIENKSNAFIEIYNSVGQLIFREQLLEKEDIYNVNFSNNIAGQYTIGIVTEKGSRRFRPVIITRR